MCVSKKEISACPIDVTLSVTDGRWKGTILWRLLDRPMRTNELRRSIPGITERMLLRHLRGDDRGRDSGASSGAGITPAGTLLANAIRTDPGPGAGGSLFVGQRTFETRFSEAGETYEIARSFRLGSTPASLIVRNPTDTGVENRRGPALPGLK